MLLSVHVLYVMIESTIIIDIKKWTDRGDIDGKVSASIIGLWAKPKEIYFYNQREVVKIEMVV
jgi:hypothetical protein